MMSSSQLEIEFEGMIDRHELYAKYGIASEAAQLFKTELGTLLLCVQGLENGWHIVPDGAKAREALDAIDRSTLGRGLNTLKRHIAIEDDLAKCFLSGLQARNQLMHGFFEKHNFKIQSEDGQKEMVANLENLHGELFKAWQSAGKLTKSTLAVMLNGSHKDE